MRPLATRQSPSFVRLSLGEAIVGAQRVAAGRDEIERLVEMLPRRAAIGRGGDDFVVERIGREWFGAGHAEDMLREHVEAARAFGGRVLRALARRLDRGRAFEHFEAVRRHEDRARGFVEPMVGAADALHQPARSLRRADIDDEIDITPVDAEIERRGADDGLEAAFRHRLLDAAALAGVERAVMQRDRQAHRR